MHAPPRFQNPSALACWAATHCVAPARTPACVQEAKKSKKRKAEGEAGGSATPAA